MQQFPAPDFNAPCPPALSDAPGGTSRHDSTDFGAPRPPAPRSLPDQPQYEALPPASDPGDGRTPLYDRLETNWFHGAQSARTAEPQVPSALEQSAASSQVPRSEPVNQGARAPRGVCRPMTNSYGRPSGRRSPQPVVSPHPACPDGYRGPTLFPVPHNSRPIRPVRRFRVPPTTYAAD